jgi:signal transduction histidine kinase
LGGSIFSLIILGGFLYSIGFILAYIISAQFSNRIIRLSYKVQEMAAGNLSRKLDVKGSDEIAQLTNAMNELISRLQSGVAQDVSKHQELNKAKTDFVALASHQLRTPLSIIKWYVDFLILGDAGPVTQEQKKYLAEVYRSNERLIELVNALLDVSRIDVGTFAIEPEPTDIIERAETALGKLSDEIAKKKITVEKQYDFLPKINLDPRLTKIVFVNILSNAVKYTPEGGRIIVKIKKTEKDIFIRITDTGCGIPKEEQPKIFTKMFRAVNAQRIESIGTGLGLYIVKAVIEKSGGKIWFESPSLDLLLEAEQAGRKLDSQKQGTTFNITMPLKGMKPRQGTKKLSSVT